MKSCPQCKTEYEDGKKFCRLDGSPLEVVSAEREPPGLRELTCSQCGKAIEAGKQFCHYCGAAIIPKAPTKIELLEQQLAADPTQIPVIVELAEEYLQEGRARRTTELLESAIVQQSENARVYLLLGGAQEARGNYEKALDAYLNALAKDAWNPDIEVALFRSEFLVQVYPRSVEELARVAASRESAHIWQLLAQVSEAKGDDEKAVSFLKEAARIKPDDVSCLEALAHLCERCQKIEEAEHWHRRILELNPNVRASPLFFAQQHYARGAYEDAIRSFEHLLAQEGGNRLYRLYWLLAKVKPGGSHRYEDGITEALRWQDLTEEEKPLACELFALAGKESLEAGNLGAAEPYLLRAHQLSPSREVAGMLAMIEEDKGNQAQKVGDLRQALVSYQRAAGYAPGNESVRYKITEVMALYTAERQRKNQALRKNVINGLGIVGGAATLLIITGVIAYRIGQEWFETPSRPAEPQVAVASPEPATDKEPPVPDNPPTSPPLGGLSSMPRMEPRDEPNTAAGMETTTEVSPSVAPSSERQSLSEGGDFAAALEKFSGTESAPTGDTETGRTENAPPRGQVMTVKELGIRVTGAGARDSTRSPNAIRQEVETHFTELQKVYESERVSTPSLMGSLVLDLTIGADGQTTRVRVQSAKIASKTLRDVVQGYAREWHFSPATGAVRVLYPLLFLPPDVEAATIIARERATASLPPVQRPPTRPKPTPPARKDASGITSSRPKPSRSVHNDSPAGRQTTLPVEKSLEQKLHAAGFHNLTVRTSGIVITLNGKVDSPEERDRVVKIANQEAQRVKYTLEWDIAVESSQ